MVLVAVVNRSGMTRGLEDKPVVAGANDGAIRQTVSVDAASMTSARSDVSVLRLSMPQ